ncbi:MAG: CRISPR-associated helicase Cas3' [Candidatus Sericytochromatia bacterium]
MTKIYAKSSKKQNNIITETLQEHTEELLENLQILKKFYYNEIDSLNINYIWRLLELACVYHDLGKVSDHFQNKILKSIKQPEIKIKKDLPKDEIPHNFLSPAFFSFIKDEIIIKNIDIYYFLFYTVAFHHNRVQNFSDKDLISIINNDLEKKVSLLDWIKKFNLDTTQKLKSKYLALLSYSSSQYKNIKNKKEYILLKGLLHRLDHSSSAHLDVESKRIEEPELDLLNYLTEESKKKNFAFKGLKPFQENAKNYRDKSIMQIASTGMGKSEFAMNWIGNDKAFYILPLRVSVNAMYERFCNTFGKEYIGLLHSNSFVYGINDLEKEGIEELEEEKLMIEEHISRMDLSKQFAMPITITTADQIFTSVFKWKGYEKIYATLMYSKLVIDEPQAYSPEILAMIICALQELSKLGCKFCFMSATIHPFIKEELENCCELLEPEYNTQKKHKISLDNSENGIIDLVEKIIYSYKEGKKVLIIVNTIKKAKELFDILKNFDESTINLKMIHSYFIQKDRNEKEQEILSDYKKDVPVIWISTQIVEASVDIDYDILFTELSSIDSLIQRMGRIFRGSDREINEAFEANIIIATEKPSGVSENTKSVYDKWIVDNTKIAIQNYNNRIISEEEKQDLMNIIFKNIKTEKNNFYEKYDSYKLLLKNGFEARSKDNAQKLFRDITNITIIPKSIYQDNKNIIDDSILKLKNKNIERQERVKNIKILNDFTVSLPFYFINSSLEKLDSKLGFCTMEIPYTKELGIDKHKKSNDNDFSYEFL